MKPLQHLPYWILDPSSLFHFSDGGALLATWFVEKVIDQGQKLVREGSAQTFFFYRDGAAATFHDGASALVKIVPTDSLTHGFVCRNTWCSVCKPDKRRNYRCHHVAAVMFLLLNRTQEGRLVPHTFLFPQSVWNHLGRSLAALTDSTNIQWSLLKNNSSCQLQGTASNGFACRVCLSEDSIVLLTFLYQKVISATNMDLAAGTMQPIITQLYQKIIEENRTEAEQQLAVMGHSARGEQIEKSVWMHLCRLISWNKAGQNLVVSRNSENLFCIASSAQEEDSFFSLTLPRYRTLEVLEKITTESLPITRMESAISCSGVFFDESNTNIIVESRIRLHDGRTFSREELAQVAYGNFYYLENEGFVKVNSLSADQEIVCPEEKQVSLFAFMNKQKEPEYRFFVGRDDIPGFLRQNKARFVNGHHKVDPDVASVEIVDIPKCLELSFFEETEEWCYLSGSYNLGKQSVNLVELLEKSTSKMEYLPGRQWLRLKDTALSWFHMLGPERIVTVQNGTVKGIRLRPHELLALSSQLPEIITDKKKKISKALASFLNMEEVGPSSEFLKIMNHLRSYQKNGTIWLAYLIRHNLGGLLADDMGLGKTHQALCCIHYLTLQNRNHRFLIVCPTGVLWNWFEKARQFFPQLAVAMYHGPGRDSSRIKSVPVTLTTFGTMRNDIDQLVEVEFEAVFFDEMQQLKNIKTMVHNAAGLLNCKSVIGLTGTPIENSLLELRALFDLCLPGFFRNEEFYNHYIRRDNKKTRKELSVIIRPFILRRTRSQVLRDLPPVIEDVRMCHLHQDQEVLYREILEHNESFRSGLLSGEKVDFMNILTMLTRLKQICNHPCLVEDCDDPMLYGSGKWEQWEEIIEECLDNRYKVVVFSQYTSMLDLMQNFLKSRDVSFCSIRGDMTPMKRQDAIRQFDEDKSCRVCLASLLAGGVGIDLTAAQVVVHYDRWWNPAKEEQATARVHRMGQQQVVQVIKLITCNTLEEKLHLLLQKKQALAADVIVEDDASILKSISREDLISLFTVNE